MSTKSKLSIAMRAALRTAHNHKVRLFTNAGVFDGLAHLVFEPGLNNPDIRAVALLHYTCPGTEEICGEEVLFDPQAIKGVHLLAVSSGNPASALNL